MILVGGMGDMVKVLHADREVSFGNRHPKTSTPKTVLKKIENHRALLQGSHIVEFVCLGRYHGVQPSELAARARAHSKRQVW